MRVLVLLATIPARKASCERLLDELSRQSAKPKGIILVLDGFGDAPAPQGEIVHVAHYRSAISRGPLWRWSCLGAAKPNDVIVCLDDDILLRTPDFIEILASEVLSGSARAAAAMGRTLEGFRAPPQRVSLGNLILGAAAGLAFRAEHLSGFGPWAENVCAQAVLDPRGTGLDDSLVSAYLWSKSIPIAHAPIGEMVEAPGLQNTSSAYLSSQKGLDFDAMRERIRSFTGWPFQVHPNERALNEIGR